jgi:hypothetical protein
VSLAKIGSAKNRRAVRRDGPQLNDACCRWLRPACHLVRFTGPRIEGSTETALPPRFSRIRGRWRGTGGCALLRRVLFTLAFEGRPPPWP